MSGDDVAKPSSSKRRAPLWARLCAIFGCVLMVAQRRRRWCRARSSSRATRARSPARTSSATRRPASERKAFDIKGPLNILLVGIDPRTRRPPLADSIIVAHIPGAGPGLPVLPAPGSAGRHPRLRSRPASAAPREDQRCDGVTAARSATASTTPPRASSCSPRPSSSSPASSEFDAGAIINFGGFKKIVDAMGGVTMKIDQNVKSEHLQPNGKPRPAAGPLRRQHLRPPLLRPPGAVQGRHLPPGGLAGARLRAPALRPAAQRL